MAKKARNNSTRDNIYRNYAVAAVFVLVVLFITSFIDDSFGITGRAATIMHNVWDAVTVYHSNALATKTVRSAAYDTSDFYGIAVPSPFFPSKSYNNLQVFGYNSATRSTAYTQLKSRLDIAGTKWIRVDAGLALDYALNNWEQCGYRSRFSSDSRCQVNELNPNGNIKILAIIDHLTISDAAHLCDPKYNFTFIGPGIQNYRLGTSKHDLGNRQNTDANFPIGAWKKLVECVVDRFKGKVHAYEIWNEPTANEFIFPGTIADGTPGNYYQMLKEAYTIIKQKDPSAQVIGLGGMFLMGGGNEVERDRRFADAVRMYNQNDPASHYVDAISVHAYTWWPYPDSGWVWKAFADNIYYYYNWAKPVWVTETGYAKFNPVEPNSNAANYLKYAYSGLIQGGAAKIFWYSLEDESGDRAFGLLGNNGISKPAHSYMKTFITTLKSGLLRVTTNPPANSKFVLKPLVLKRNYGVNWDQVPAGTYKLGFLYPKSPIHAKEFTVEIRNAKTTEIVAFPSSGTISTAFHDAGGLPSSTGLLRVYTRQGEDVIIYLREDTIPIILTGFSINWRSFEAGPYLLQLSYADGKGVSFHTVDLKAAMTTVIELNVGTGTITKGPYYYWA